MASATPAGLPRSGAVLDYRVAHGYAGGEAGSLDVAASGKKPAASRFVLVTGAGDGEADGIYKPVGRRWLNCEVLQNDQNNSWLLSREATSRKDGSKRHGFLLGRSGTPAYGVQTERLCIPSKAWKVLHGSGPAPEVQSFENWAEVCLAAARHYGKEASRAADGGFWQASLALAEQAVACHRQAQPKGRTKMQSGAAEWSEEICEVLATRADACLHLREYRKALLDACAALHFVAAFDWKRARTRGLAACAGLGISEAQAKLLIDEACRRDSRSFQSLQDLEPWVDGLVRKAQGGELVAMVLPEEVPDDGRLYFEVIDPEECKIRAAPNFEAKVLREVDFGQVLRGSRITPDGVWLELHVAEAFDDASGDTTAFAPIFSVGDADEEEEREEVMERIAPKDYPPRPRWEQLGLSVQPLGLKPVPEEEVPRDRCRWIDARRPHNAKEWPYIYKHELAICTVLRNAPESVIDSFIRYHWGIGFNHLFFFFDDEEDAGLPVAREFEEMCRSKQVEACSVTIQIMTDQWWDDARATSRYYQRKDVAEMYEAVCNNIDSYGDEESRQVVAIDMALLEAHRLGVDWFAVLDINECMYVPQKQDCSARRYLGSKPRSVDYVRLWNHEAIPEKTDCEDWFRESTLFQMNRQHCQGFKPPREYDEVLRRREGISHDDEAQNPDTAWFRDDVQGPLAHRRHAAARAMQLEELGLEETAGRSAAYDEGRCIVRLDQHFPPPLPLGTRGFLADSGELLEGHYQANASDDAVILHYPNASLASWRNKYETLGALKKPVLDKCEPGDLHVASSFVVLDRDRRAQEQFYKTFVMQDDFGALPFLASQGLLRRVEGVKDLLESWDEPPEENEILPGQQRWYHPSGLQLAAP
eukprot:TRINITY_DN32462_c0_g1_i1.p1 TRINITY_DN32462_c0_g1~~TRINITY_DN32462_c0_g1_i1.p1  ORF type:complete len:874 (-),score=186.47 TRINITY_DN32462_c0_g1_i1:37-2658(-)